MFSAKPNGIKPVASMLLAMVLCLALAATALGQAAPLKPTKRSFLRPPQRTTTAQQSSTTAKPAPGRQDDGRVALTFKDVDIRVLIQFIAKLTGKTYVVSEKVTGRVTIITPGPVDVDEAVRIFGSVLEVNGYTTVDQGSVVKVIPIQGARREGVAVLPAGKLPSPRSDSMVTQMVNLQHASARDVRAILVPLAGRHAYVTAHTETNSLVITDIASNVYRLAKLAKGLDVPGAGTVIEVITLKYARATDLAKALKTLFGGRTAAAVKGKAPAIQSAQSSLLALADERSNSLILVGPKVALAKAREVVSRLDLPDVEGQFNIHVIHLRHAVAEDLAELLGELSGGGTAPQPVSASNSRQGGAAAAEDKVKILSADVRMVADKATNSLIIQASPQEFKVLKSIIARLDIPRTMVYVEAVILETTAEKSLEFGITWQGALEEGGGAGFGGVGGKVSTAPLTEAIAGLSMGIIGSAITVSGITFPNLSALVRAAQTDKDIRVVATPQILTADNEEATVLVAENLPFVTRVDQGDQETSRAIQSFDYKDVGYTLKVTPRISDSGVVRMTVEVEHKSVVASNTTDSAGATILAPTTRVRNAKTTIVSPDNDIVVIGGLIGNETESSGSQVPCLGDVPLLGWAVGKNSKDTGKRTNLLIFISPHILTSYGEARKLTGDKLDEGRKGAPDKPEDLLTPLRPDPPDPAILDRMLEAGED